MGMAALSTPLFKRIGDALKQRFRLLVALLVAVLLVGAAVHDLAWCLTPLQPGSPGPCPAWLDARYPELPAGAAGAALAAARDSYGEVDPALPFFDVVVVVPSPAAWAARREALRRQFARSLALLPPGTSATLLFVVGARGPGAPVEDAGAADILLVDCADVDGGWPLTDSATTCKVARALAEAVARFRFHFFARVGDDAYFRVDTFLARVAPAHVAPARRGSLVLSWWMTAGGLQWSPELGGAIGGPPGFPALGHYPYPGGLAFIFGYNATAALAAVWARVGLVDSAPEDLIVGAWLAPLGHARVDRVHTPCFHNVATRVVQPDALLGLASRHWLAAPCTPQSLVMHYMTPELWAAVEGNGNLHCGSTVCGS